MTDLYVYICDERQQYLYEYLLQTIFDVNVIATDASWIFDYHISNNKKPINLVLSQPLTTNNKHIKNTSIEIKKFFSSLPAYSCIFAGNICNNICSIAVENNIEIFDYNTNQDIKLKNSIDTAEGTIMAMIQNSPITLHESSTLILGNGLCATSLAVRLKYLCSRVTLAARDINSVIPNIDCVSIYKLSEYINQYNYIINTIPATIIDNALLKSIFVNVNSSIITNPTYSDTVLKLPCIIDIASAPGGIDHSSPYIKHLNITHFLSIPALTSPKSSARYLGDYIISNFSNRK